MAGLIEMFRNNLIVLEDILLIRFQNQKSQFSLAFLSILTES